MNRDERHMVRIMFQLLIYKSDGQAFEDLFTLIMRKVDSEFESIKPYGRIGDMKNDGFNRTTGEYYQVFGPEDSEKNKTIYDAVQKVRNDFEGLVKNWNHICSLKIFNYVFNDKYKGANPLITQELIKLESENNGILCKLFPAKKLEDYFWKLPEYEMTDIVGFIPSTEIDLLDYDILNEVIQFIMKHPAEFNLDSKFKVPDFEEKIIFNNLSKSIEYYLHTGSYSEGALDEYFNNNSDFTRNELKLRFNEFYLESKTKISEQEEDYADKRFMYIFEKACPRNEKAVRDSTLVLMSHYFETCDIFEEPVKEGKKNDIATKTY